MLKFTCRDVGLECDAKFESDDSKVLMEEVKVHAAGEHNLPDMPPEVEEKIVSAITNDSAE